MSDERWIPRWMFCMTVVLIGKVTYDCSAFALGPVPPGRP
jgi:hypothetical protein